MANYSKIIEIKHSRGGLIEGRTTGHGFAFLTKKKNKFETAMPVSTCKDYLNDVVGRINGLPEFTIYGFKYNDSNKIYYKGYYYLLMYNYRDDEYSEQVNYDNIKLINVIEKKLNLDKLTEIKHETDDLIILRVPKYWCQTSYHISFYTEILRNLPLCETDPLNFKDYIQIGNHEYLEKVFEDLNEELVGQDFNIYSNFPSKIHNHGYVYYIDAKTH